MAHVSFLIIQSAPEISTITAGQGLVVVADIHGQVHVCNPDFDVTKSWIAHVNGRVTHMRLAGAKGVLVTIGVGRSSSMPTISTTANLGSTTGRRSITAPHTKGMEYPT